MKITEHTRCGKKDAKAPDGYTNKRFGGNTVANDIQIGHHARTLEDLEGTGWMVRVETICDPLTHKPAKELSDDGVLIRYLAVELSPEEKLAKAQQDFAAKADAFTEELQQFVHKTAWDVGKYGHLGVGNIYNCACYIGIGSPYEAECVALLTWNSAVWVKCNAILAAVVDGERPEPTIEELIDELPIYEAV